MPGIKDIQHSVLIISASEKFDTLVKQSLPPRTYIGIDCRKSASLARRSILERYYDLIIINAPLPDENGMDIAMDVTDKCNASVLLVVPKEVYEDVAERVSDLGILVVPKPSPKGSMDRSIRFLTANRNKLRMLEKKVRTVQEKMEELRLVDHVKLLLIEKKKMTEDEAHRHIGKLAMDNGVSRGRMAQMLLDDLE